LTQPLASAAKTPNNDDISAMLEQIQLLNRRLDVESTARVQLEKRANEVDKWKTDYVKLEDYKSIVQKSNNIERLYEALKEGRDNERETRANLGDGLEDLQQRYYRLDKMVQSLQNTKGELESKIISMHMVNDMQRMRIEDLEAGMNGAQTRLKDLESENSGLKTELGILQNDNAALHTDVTNLQTSNTKLDGQVLNLTNENDKLHQSLEGLQQHNNSLQADVTALQAENINLKTEVAELQKAKTNLDREVGLLKERNSSLQQENQTLKARLSKALSNGRLSNWTVDSGLGSPRESIASPRKRPISITEVREEKRPKGLERDSTFEGNVGSMSLPLEQIAEDSAMYEMSKLPYRSGRNSPEVPQSDGYFF
jgi:chromosome segregation ATPase